MDVSSSRVYEMIDYALVFLDMQSSLTSSNSPLINDCKAICDALSHQGGKSGLNGYGKDVSGNYCALSEKYSRYL